MHDEFGFGGVALLDRSGKLVAGGPIAAGGATYEPVSQSLAAALAKPSVMAAKTSCGVLAAAEAHYLYCSAPVVHTDGSGTPAGTLVALKTLERPELLRSVGGRI